MAATNSEPDDAQRRYGDAMIARLARRFADALLSGDPYAAEATAQDALSGGLDVPAVHTFLMEPAMRSVGELWQANQVSVSHEHLATAITHEVAAGIFGRGLRREAGAREKVMLAAVQGEHHVLGLRLAADVLEGAGFSVLYLGADVPLPALLDACQVHEPAVLGFTVSMWLNVPTLIWEIQELLKLPSPPRIIVGGRAVGPAVQHGLSAPVVEHSNNVIEVVEAVISKPGQSPILSPELSARIPGRPPSGVWGAEELSTVPAAFSVTSEAGAEMTRGAARRAHAMEHLALHDPLTGLFNRRAFDDALHDMSESGSSAGSLLMIDVDRFKSINDTYGHESGDRALVSIGEAIEASLRPSDFAARFGGDQFVVLLRGKDSAGAASVAERIRARVASAATEVPFTISVGVAELASDPRLTSQSADQALYRAKASGRNVVAQAES